MATKTNPLNAYFETTFTAKSEIYKFFRRKGPKYIYAKRTRHSDKGQTYNFYIAPDINKIININFIFHDLGVGRFTSNHQLFFGGLNNNLGVKAVQNFSKRCYGDYRLICVALD